MSAPITADQIIKNLHASGLWVSRGTPSLQPDKIVGSDTVNSDRTDSLVPLDADIPPARLTAEPGALHMERREN